MAEMTRVQLLEELRAKGKKLAVCPSNAEIEDGADVESAKEYIHRVGEVWCFNKGRGKLEWWMDDCEAMTYKKLLAKAKFGDELELKCQQGKWTPPLNEYQRAALDITTKAVSIAMFFGEEPESLDVAAQVKAYAKVNGHKMDGVFMQCVLVEMRSCSFWAPSAEELE
jgi:hypothetical protein